MGQQSTSALIFIAFLIGLIALFIPLVAEQSKNLSLLDIESLQANVENLDGGHHLHMQFSKQVFEKISKFLTELPTRMA